MRIPLVAAAVLAGVIVLLTTVLPTPVGPQPSQAMVLLSRLAVEARHQATSLRPGQYYYTEISTQTWIGPIFFDGSPSGLVHNEYLEGTVQTWVAADGSGRRVDTTDPTPRFFDRADYKAWVAAGKPPTLVPSSQLTTVQDFGPGGVTTIGLPIPLYTGPIPLYRVSWLPTSPMALSRVLGAKGISKRFESSQWMGGWPVQGIGFATQCPTPAPDTGIAPSRLAGSCRRFVRAVALLQGPDIGQTPQLRQALYRVMATVGGVKAIGRTTDRAGQSGVGFELVQRSPAETATLYCEDDHEVSLYGPPAGNRQATRHVLHFPATATTLKVVVNPRTTTVLSSETSVSPLGPGVHFPASCGSYEIQGSDPTWLMVLRTGIVNSETAVPANTSG